MNDKNLLIAVFAQLEREGTVSIPQLARLLDVNEKRVWDALEVLVFCYDSVSLRLDLQQSHATLVDGGTSRLLRLTEDETGLLIDALETQGIPPGDGLCTKLLDARGFLDGSSEGSPCASRPQTQMVGTGNAGEVMEAIARACDDPAHHLLAIEYQADGSERAVGRVVEPRSLEAAGDRWYLHAYCRASAGWRSFRTDRVRRAVSLEETFVPRAETGDDAEKPVTARLRIKAGCPLPDWPGIRESPKASEDGTREAAVPWLGGMWLPKRIVATFGDVVALDPPGLVEKTRGYARSLLA